MSSSAWRSAITTSQSQLARAAEPRGPRGQFIPEIRQLRGLHMALDHWLFVVFTCAQSVTVIHSFIHLLHTALASGAVYCSRSCLCVYGGRAARRACGCPNFTTVQARSVCPSVSTFFIHSLNQLLLRNSPQTLIVPEHLKFKCNNDIRQRRNWREWGRRSGWCQDFPTADLSTFNTTHALVVRCSDAVWQWLDRNCWLWIDKSSTGPCGEAHKASVLSLAVAVTCRWCRLKICYTSCREYKLYLSENSWAVSQRITLLLRP